MTICTRAVCRVLTIFMLLGVHLHGATILGTMPITPGTLLMATDTMTLGSIQRGTAILIMDGMVHIVVGIRHGALMVGTVILFTGMAIMVITPTLVHIVIHQATPRITGALRAMEELSEDAVTTIVPRSRLDLPPLNSVSRIAPHGVVNRQPAHTHLRAALVPSVECATAVALVAEDMSAAVDALADGDNSRSTIQKINTLQFSITI